MCTMEKKVLRQVIQYLPQDFVLALSKFLLALLFSNESSYRYPAQTGFVMLNRTFSMTAIFPPWKRVLFKIAQ